MWTFTTDSMLSCVEDPSCPDNLLVRARLPGDIGAAFPDATVQRTPDRDYGWRASIPKAEVAARVAEMIRGIDYGNFKATLDPCSAVDATARRHFYTATWAAGRQAQEEVSPLVGGRPARRHAVARVGNEPQIGGARPGPRRF